MHFYYAFAQKPPELLTWCHSLYLFCQLTLLWVLLQPFDGKDIVLILLEESTRTIFFERFVALFETMNKLRRIKLQGLEPVNRTKISKDIFVLPAKLSELAFLGSQTR
jgi:hypothetical protein